MMTAVTIFVAILEKRRFTNGRMARLAMCGLTGYSSVLSSFGLCLAANRRIVILCVSHYVNSVFSTVFYCLLSLYYRSLAGSLMKP